MDLILAVDRSFESGSLLTNPGALMEVIFLLCIEGTVAAFVVGTACSILKQERRRSRVAVL
jgi:hypothetical protein